MESNNSLTLTCENSDFHFRKNAKGTNQEVQNVRYFCNFYKQYLNFLNVFIKKLIKKTLTNAFFVTFFQHTSLILLTWIQPLELKF